MTMTGGLLLVMAVAIPAILRIAMWRIEATDRRVLAAMTTDQMSGYAIGQRAGINLGSLYATLCRLEESGQIVGEWGPVYLVERGGYRRRYYRKVLLPEPR